MIATVLLGAASFVAVAAQGAGAAADVSPQTQATTERGERLVTRFLDSFAPDADPGDLETVLSPAFVLQRADGSSADRSAYLDDPAIVESYEISDLQATRTGPVLVARYTLVVDSTIEGRQQSGDPAPRLTVFVKGDDGWQVVAHANFNSLVDEPAPEG